MVSLFYTPYDSLRTVKFGLPETIRIEMIMSCNEVEGREADNTNLSVN